MVRPRTGTLARPFALVDMETAGQSNLLAAMVEDPLAVNQVYKIAVQRKYHSR